MHRLSAALFALILSACSAGTSRTPASSTDIEKLSHIITLPARPIFARWQTIEISRAGLGPGDWACLAYLEYDEADANTMPASRSRTAASLDVSITNAVDAPMRAALERIFIGASYEAFDAQAFYRSPLIHGFILRKRGALIVYLYTM